MRFLRGDIKMMYGEDGMFGWGMEETLINKTWSNAWGRRFTGVLSDGFSYKTKRCHRSD